SPSVTSAYVQSPTVAAPLTNVGTSQSLPVAGYAANMNQALATRLSTAAPTSQIDRASAYALDLTDKQVDEQNEQAQDLRPVSFVPSSGAAVQAKLPVQTVEAGDALIKHAGHAQLSVDKQTGVVTLNRGEILVVARKQTTVIAGRNTVTLNAGVVAIV